MEERLIRDYVEHCRYALPCNVTISNIRIKGEYVCFDAMHVGLNSPERYEIELISVLAFVNWRVSSSKE